MPRPDAAKTEPTFLERIIAAYPECAEMLTQIHAIMHEPGWHDLGTMGDAGIQKADDASS